MILILSSATDVSTQTVCKWLKHQKKDFIVIHSEDKLRIESISLDDCLLKIEERNLLFRIQDVTSFWYRRDNFSIIESDESFNINLSEFVKANQLADEFTALYFIHFLLLTKRSFGSAFTANVNKFEMLYSAKKIGLNVPDFILTKDKNEILRFLQYHQKVIYKTPSPGIIGTFKTIDVSSLTKVFTKEMLQDNIGLTFFQKQITKKYEIRSFFLNGAIYSIAILTQKNEKTAVDYRNYDTIKPNRSVPYLLPKSIRDKLIKFLNQFKLECCSVDMIVSNEDEHYFLEVNPIGQFGNVSFHRNEYLEKEIALLLN